MEHKISMVRAEKRNRMVDLKNAFTKILNKIHKKIEENPEKVNQKMIKAERQNERALKLWDNVFLNRPKLLLESSPEEIAQAIYEAGVSIRFNEKLTKALNYPVKLSVDWFDSFSFQRTAPKLFYIIMEFVWDIEDLHKERVMQDNILTHYERGGGEILHIRNNEIPKMNYETYRSELSDDSSTEDDSLEHSKLIDI